MREHQNFHDLIGDIYDTALDQNFWTEAIGKVVDFTGSQCGGLVSKDSVSKLAISPYNWGVDPHYVQLYEQTYSQFDPLAILPRFGQVASVPDLVSYDDYKRGPFIQEWLLPQGLVDVGLAMLDNQGPKCAVVLALLRGKKDGMIDDVSRKRMALVVPHVRRALRIGKATGLESPGKETFADILDGLNTAIFLVDEQGRIVHANVTGHDMLYANDILGSVGGRLTASDAQVNQTLKDLFATAAKGDAWFGAKAIAQAMTAHDGERYVAHVLPLTSGERRWTGLAFAAVAAVFVRKVGLESSIESIAQTYNLTPTELRVLNAIVQSAAFRRQREPWAWQRPLSKRISTACSIRPTPAARRTLLSLWPVTPIRCLISLRS